MDADPFGAGLLGNYRARILLWNNTRIGAGTPKSAGVLILSYEECSRMGTRRNQSHLSGVARRNQPPCAVDFSQCERRNLRAYRLRSNLSRRVVFDPAAVAFRRFDPPSIGWYISQPLSSFPLEPPLGCPRSKR